MGVKGVIGVVGKVVGEPDELLPQKKVALEFKLQVELELEEEVELRFG